MKGKKGEKGEKGETGEGGMMKDEGGRMKEEGCKSGAGSWGGKGKKGLSDL
jgi:hypothetical protein